MKTFYVGNNSRCMKISPDLCKLLKARHCKPQIKLIRLQGTCNFASFDWLIGPGMVTEFASTIYNEGMCAAWSDNLHCDGSDTMTSPRLFGKSKSHTNWEVGEMYLCNIMRRKTPTIKQIVVRIRDGFVIAYWDLNRWFVVVHNYVWS